VKYWVFTEQQLAAALAAYMMRHRREMLCTYVAERAHKLGLTESAIRDFLDSPEAREHKLWGGASYEPDRTP